MAKETVARVDLRPIIYGTADEGRDRPARDIEFAFLAGIDGDMSKVMLAGGDPAVRRAALHRVAGRCLALLALDEIVRGSDAIEREFESSEVFG